MNLKMLLAVLVVSASIPAFSQVAPEAEPRLPLSVGVAYSNFNTDWTGRLQGPMFWANYSFYNRPAFLNGFGIEVEGRDLNYGRSAGQYNLRMDTIAGGPIYTVRHYRRFHPYAKYLIGYGSIDFTLLKFPNYKHDSRTVYDPGGGAEYRVWQNVWVRGDYEYQFWTSLFNHHDLNPRGFTIGAAYDFRGAHSR